MINHAKGGGFTNLDTTTFDYRMVIPPPHMKHHPILWSTIHGFIPRKMFFGAVHMHGGWDSCRSLIDQVLHFLSRSNWDIYIYIIYVWALVLPACGRKYLSP